MDLTVRCSLREPGPFQAPPWKQDIVSAKVALPLMAAPELMTVCTLLQHTLRSTLLQFALLQKMSNEPNCIRAVAVAVGHRKQAPHNA
jgi:hypothetical protein